MAKKWIKERLKEAAMLSSPRKCERLCATRMLSKIIPNCVDKKGWVWNDGKRGMHVTWNGN